VVFIGQQIRRQCSPTDGGARQRAASQPTLQTIVEHRVETIDLGQRPEGHGEFAEKQHILDVLSACGHVRHDKRRTNAPVRSIAEADASNHDSVLHLLEKKKK
jgi:hypothetical protein